MSLFAGLSGFLSLSILLATAMHEAGKFELLNVAENDLTDWTG